MATISQHVAVRNAEVSRAQFLLVFSKTLIYVVLLAIAVVEAFPLVWMLLTSVKNQREVFNSFLPQTLDFSNFPACLGSHGSADGTSSTRSTSRR